MQLTKKNNGFIAFLLVAITLNTCCMDQVKKEDIGWAALVGGILLGTIPLKQLFFPIPNQPVMPKTIIPETVTPSTPFPFTDLPKDLQKNIIQLLSINTTAESLEVTAQTIRSLTQVNKELNALINDPKFCLELIKNLAQRFNCSDMQAAEALHTQEAKRRLEAQIELNNSLYRFTTHYLEQQLPNITLTLNSLIQEKDIDLEFTSNVLEVGENAAAHTPLMFCCAKMCQPVALILINKGAKLNTRNNHGNTALMISIYKANEFAGIENLTEKSIKIIRALLDAGADPEIANNAGLTPLAAAQQTDNQELIDLIKNAIDKKHGKIKLE